MGDETEKKEPRTVPYERFEEVTKAKRDLLVRQGELDGVVKDLEKKAATVDALTTQLSDLRKQFDAEKANWNMDRAALQIGITDAEGVDVARMLWNKVEEKVRPAFDAWLKGHADTPDKAPKALAAYLPGKQARSAGGGEAAGGGGGLNKGAKNQGGAGGAQPVYSADKIRELRETAQRSGNWDEYKKARGAIMDEVTRR